MKKFFIAAFAIAIMLSADVLACTSAIITGKATPDGRPLMWKHRDTGELNNKVKHLNCEFPLIFWFVQNLYNFT